jgi:alpha-beta hydrolase superfamily lysophospholipase
MMSSDVSTSDQKQEDVSTAEFWVPSSDGHELRVLEARHVSTKGLAPSILFIHGVFSDGRFFFGARGGGARWFCSRGFVAYVADLRGHGNSRWPPARRWSWNFDMYVRDDIPALVSAVRARTRGPLFVVAHSMGGYAALAAIATNREVQRNLQGVAVLSCAVNDFTDGGISKRLALYASLGIARVTGHFPARFLKQGPSDEPTDVMAQFVRWAERRSFESHDGATNYWAALDSVQIPVLSAVGEADRFHASPARARKLLEHLGSSDKALRVFGRSSGLEVDLGHVDLARGPIAERVVFPEVRNWMLSRVVSSPSA